MACCGSGGDLGVLPEGTSEYGKVWFFAGNSIFDFRRFRILSVQLWFYLNFKELVAIPPIRFKDLSTIRKFDCFGGRQEKEQGWRKSEY